MTRVAERWLTTATGDKGVTPSMESGQIRRLINTADTAVSQLSKVIMSSCRKPALVGGQRSNGSSLIGTAGGAGLDALLICSSHKGRAGVMA